MQIPITKAIFDVNEKEAIVKPLETGWLVQGPYVASFENKLKAYLDIPFAKAVSSCTTALHLALDALGIGKGDKVVVPSFTYVASANAVLYTGAEVVFCDIELDSFTLDVNHLEKLLQEDKTITAVMPVHLFGAMCDMTPIMSLAKTYDLKVIEDAACALGSFYKEQAAGTFGDAGCFSFHPRKVITTGEGGLLTTKSEELFTLVKELSDHGATKSDLERHKNGGSLLPDFIHRGFNYRMTDFQGAIGVAQMDKLQTILKGRANIAKQYTEALSDVTWLMTPKTPANTVHSYQSYVCLFGDSDFKSLSFDEVNVLNVKRNALMQKLEDKGIATRQGTHAVHTLSFYQKRYNLKPTDYPNSYLADRLSITLPVYADMTKEEFDWVIAQLKSV